MILAGSSRMPYEEVITLHAERKTSATISELLQGLHCDMSGVKTLTDCKSASPPV